MDCRGIKTNIDNTKDEILLSSEDKSENEKEYKIIYTQGSIKFKVNITSKISNMQSNIMKLNKRLLALIMSAMLTVPFIVGCSDDNVTEQLPETSIQQEQPIEQEKPITDEDLNDQYKAKINERQQVSDLDQAEQIIDKIMAENFQGIEYMILKENGALVIILNIPANDSAFSSMEQWNELVGTVVEYDIMIQQALQQFGLNVPTATMVANIESDTPLLVVINGEVMYDVFNGIDKIN